MIIKNQLFCLWHGYCHSTEPLTLVHKNGLGIQTTGANLWFFFVVIFSGALLMNQILAKSFDNLHFSLLYQAPFMLAESEPATIKGTWP